MDEDEKLNINLYSEDTSPAVLDPETATWLLDRMEEVDARIAALSPEEFATREAERRRFGEQVLAQIRHEWPKKKVAV